MANFNFELFGISKTDLMVEHDCEIVFLIASESH